MDDPTAGPGGLRLEVEPEDPHDEVIARVSAALLHHPLVRQDFTLADLWMVSFDVLGKDAVEDRGQWPAGADSGQWPAGADSGRFRAVVRDLASGRVLTAEGHLDDPENLAVGHTAFQLPPTDDEFAWAVDALDAGDRVTGPYRATGEVAYRPMPPLGMVENADGSAERVIAVGLRTATGGHRVVGVSAADGSYVAHPVGAVPPSESDCGAPPAEGDPCPSVSGPRRARVRVWREDELLWDLVVVRPSASSGLNGSGVELQAVEFRGRRVLHRAHVPIVNVAYDAADGSEDEAPDRGHGDTARHWQNEEACFDAPGENTVQGFRMCAGPPATILESGVDGGAFRGVALWWDRSGSEQDAELVIVSQLQAGWYRYVSEWRLSADGAIRPRFGFSAAANPRTCRPHTHHAYWRFDFDIVSDLENVVQEFNETPVFGTSNWHTMRYEAARRRSPASGRYWRVRQDRSSAAYQLMPGAGDGEPDDFGAGDVWILNYRESEIDDEQGFTTDLNRARAQLDRFVSGEPVHRQDLVVWYAAHVRHGTAGGEGEWDNRVGPDLVPRHWTSAPAAQEGDMKPSDLAPPAN